METKVELHCDARGVARVMFRSENGVQLLSAATRDQLRLVLDVLEADETCRVVVFEAEGRTFFAGANIDELKQLTARDAYRFSREGQRLFQRIADLPMPTIAAVHAACAGGGCELSLACDIRLAGAGARIGLPEVTIGVIPGWGGTVRATRLFGPAVARRMILSGQLFPAAEAHALGIVHDVFPDSEFRDRVNGCIDQILKGGPLAVRSCKLMIGQFANVRGKGDFRREARQFAACYHTAEPREGLGAFLEKRPADWGVSSPPAPPPK